MASEKMSDPRPGHPVTIGSLKIEPIERTEVRGAVVRGAIVVVATKEPVSVIIRSPAGTWHVDLASADDTTS